MISITLDAPTARCIQVVNITPQVAEAVAHSEVGNGLCFVHSQHATMGVAINEDEPLPVGDMERWLSEIVRDDPEMPRFQHSSS